jgi:hypothetical protein
MWLGRGIRSGPVVLDEYQMLDGGWTVCAMANPVRLIVYYWFDDEDRLHKAGAISDPLCRGSA